MMYVIVVYVEGWDEFKTEYSIDVSGIKDLADRIESIIGYYERSSASQCTLISVTHIGKI